MSRHVWLDLDQPIQPAKLNAARITRTYGDSRKAVFAAGFERGIYRVQSWDDLGPEAFAAALSADVARWGGDPGKQLAVHANIELHDPNYLLAFISAWRWRRPLRETAIVLEGYQAGWFTPALVARINTDPNLVVLAEAYDGAMSPYGPDDVRCNLVEYGVSRAKARLMYDAARLTSYWDGCAFTQQRLP